MKERVLKFKALVFLRKREVKITLLILLILYFCLFFTRKINLITADLGRHIKNGEYFFSTKKPLETNYYSYTFASQKTVNHHWGIGPIFSLIWKNAGFSGLSIFYTGLYLAAFLLFFFTAKKKSDFYSALFASLIVVPIAGSRKEIRPEVFSYLFTAIYYFVLEKYRNKEINWKVILGLFLIQVFWVNVHILFVIGPFLTLIYLLDVLFFGKNKKKIKQLLLLLVILGLTNLINPFFLKGTFITFEIFGDYGYQLAENMNVFFMQKFFPEFRYVYLEIIITILFLSFLSFFRRKIKLKVYFIELVLGIFFSLFSLFMIRNIPFIGLFFIPIFSLCIYNISERNERMFFLRELIIFSCVLFFGFVFFTKNKFFSIKQSYSGIGLLSKNLSSAEFFKNKKIEGPIFNNYDIGGYLIFNLFPEYKVFVDNRPEAYTVNFFENIYKPMQMDNKIWKEKLDEYGFNAIFFYRLDLTAWGQNFLIERVRDKEWVPIFVDDYTIIFVRNVSKNKELIEDYKLPEGMFRVI